MSARRTLATGEKCVGDLRLSPLDVGFDLRLHDIAVELPDEFSSVGLDVGGAVYLVEGNRAEMVRAILDAGYRIAA